MNSRKFLILLCIVVLAPSIVWAGESVPDEIRRVVNRGYLGQGGLNLDENINRAELSAVVVRLLGLEDEAKDFKGQIPFKDVKEFQKGWATPYVALAYREGIIQGINPTTFNPKGQVSYVEMLTIFMRILGYEDGIDFVKYPDDYFIKAVEIGLGHVYMDMDDKVTRRDVALAIEKLLDLSSKDKDNTLIEKLDKRPSPVKKEEKVYMNNLDFNTSITGIFKGQLKGRKDFSDYKVELLSKEYARGDLVVYDKVSVDKDGVFKIWNFDISWTAKFRGYQYRVYNGKGDLILEGELR